MLPSPLTDAARPHRSGLKPGRNRSMTEPGAWPKLPSRWAGVAAKLPETLDYLHGPSGGVVELPADLAWSGDRSFDLGDMQQRYLYQMTVLTAAVTREHYTRWLNADLLRSDWPRLRLPRQLRGAWHDRFPELAKVTDHARRELFMTGGYREACWMSTVRAPISAAEN